MWFIYSLDPARGKVLLAGGVMGASSGLGEAGNNRGGDVEPDSLPPFFFCRQSPVRVRRSHKNELASQPDRREMRNKNMTSTRAVILLILLFFLFLFRFLL